MSNWPGKIDRRLIIALLASTIITLLLVAPYVIGSV